jgi:8-oxo-dGTP pyrophosphatase MutT (NUDIX family)
VHSPAGGAPADRARQVIADATASARPRRRADGTDPAVPVAATAVIVRDGAAGLEALMMERPDRGSFAGAWVFPGGRLEPADGAGADEAIAARRAAVRETREEIGLELDAASLQPLSCWDPPPGIALRLRTWFFLAVDPDAPMFLAPDEVVAAEWVRPADMLIRHGRGEVTLYPPTWVTLHEIAEQPDVEAVFAVARIGGVRRYETVARRGEDGPLLLWHGDAEYDDDAATGADDAATGADDAATGAAVAASRHRLDLSSLPWVYTRSP